MTTIASFDENQQLHMEELYSKIHDEHKCLTVKGVSLELGISRKEASSLLEALPYYESGNKSIEPSSSSLIYDVIRFVWDSKSDGKCGTYCNRLSCYKFRLYLNDHLNI